MKLYTVKQVAKLAGVSVRALHHYDQIGLLKPASVGENGYRYYGREELLRLQQILFHRELEFPLESIAAVLDQPGFDRVAALTRHRARLAAEVRRYRRLLKTLDDTLAALKGETEMDESKMYKGFDPAKQAEYEAWLVERYGDSMGEQISKSWIKASREVSAADAEKLDGELKVIDRAMGDALLAAAPADAGLVQALIARHYAIVTRFWSPSRTGYIGLGELYMEHPKFRERFEAVTPGLTEYLAAAMKVYAEQELT